MRERGSQSRRARVNDPTVSFRPGPPSSGGGSSFWPALAIAAIIAATAGWTTVAVLALNGDRGPAATSSGIGLESDLPSDLPSDQSLEPDSESHVFPDLEALLPQRASGSELAIQSWTGDLNSGDDSVSVAVDALMATKGKTAADLQVAQAIDLDSDLTITVFRASGFEPSAIRDAMVGAIKTDTPEFEVADTTIKGRQVTSGTYPDETYAQYWYTVGDLLFTVEGSDIGVASTVLGTLSASPQPRTSESASPSGSGPAGSSGAGPSTAAPS